MIPWKLTIWDEVNEDYEKLGKTQKRLVDKAIFKVLQNPLPQNESGYGKPLGNKCNVNLTGCYKIKLRDAGIRIVYRLQRTEHGMEIVIIGMRESAEVYDLAAKRIEKYDTKAN